MLGEIETNPEFSEVLRLHNYVQKIKKKHQEVHQQSNELRTMFDSLLQRTAGAANPAKEKRKTGEKKEEAKK